MKPIATTTPAKDSTAPDSKRLGVVLPRFVRRCAWPHSRHSWGKNGKCKHCKQAKPETPKRKYRKKLKLPAPEITVRQKREAFRCGYKVGLLPESGPDENPYTARVLVDRWMVGWLAGSERCIRKQSHTPNDQREERAGSGASPKPPTL